ncbi:MAG TPA: hypothetical protein VHT91_13120 [Kofleriaceae bacterium]|jgi:hypothetical protein|nr:hypothetical protein [Kofleriaceae bacterium]
MGLVRVAASATCGALHGIGILQGMRGLVSCDKQARARARKPDVAAKRKALGTELCRRVAAESSVWAEAASGRPNNDSIWLR